MKVPVKDKAHAARAACIGKLTDCCQSLSGEAGEPCAIHGLTSEHGGFYVVCKGDVNDPKVEDPLLAASWVWRSQTGALVLDSIESSYRLVSDALRQKLIVNSSIRLFRELAKEMVEHGYADKVTCGASSGISTRVGLENASCDPERPKDYSGYRDSKRQLVLYDKAKPYYTADLYLESKENHQSKMKEILSDKHLLDVKYSRDGLQYVFGAMQYFEQVGRDELFFSETESYSNEYVSDDQKARINTLRLLLAGLLVETSSNINIKVISNLINKDTDLNAIGPSGDTFIHHLARRDVVDGDRDLIQEIVRKLIDHGARMDIKNSRGRTALEEAAYYANASMLECILDEETINTVFIGRYGATTALHIAIENKNTELLNKLIEMGAKTDIKDGLGRTAFECAAYCVNADALTRLVNEENLNTIFEGGRGHATTALHLAIERNDKNLFNKLIQLGADADIKDGEGKTVLERAVYDGNTMALVHFPYWINKGNVNAVFKTRRNVSKTALFIAAENIDLEGVGRLIKMGADVNWKNNEHENILYTVANNFIRLDKTFFDSEEERQSRLKRNEALLVLLLENMLDINKKNENIIALLGFAVKNRDLMLVDLLIKHGGQINKSTVLFKAVGDDWLYGANFLIKKGANVNEKDEQGTPLCFKAQTIEMFENLIQHGADIGAVDKLGKTVLHHAAFIDDKAIVNFLIEQGIDVNVKDQSGCTPLISVARLNFGQNKDLGMLSFLIDKGADVNASDDKGRTALGVASANRNLDKVALLIKHGANINAKDSGGFTALHQAVIAQHVGIFRHLLEQGSDVNIQDNEGNSVLHKVIKMDIANNLFCRLTVVNLLLGHGANINLKDKSGETALDIARRSNDMDIIRLLEEHERKSLHTKKSFTPMKDNRMNILEVDSKDLDSSQASDRISRGPGQ